MQNPEIITQNVKRIVLDLLPVKSCQMYEKAYEAFVRWREINNIVIVDEDAMLNYLHKKVSYSLCSISITLLATWPYFKRGVTLSNLPKFVLN